MNIFAPEQITKMKAALAQATESTMPDTATQALMAECILQSAARGSITRRVSQCSRRSGQEQSHVAVEV